MKKSELRQLIKEEISKITKIKDSERLNPRQEEIAPGVINYYFDKIDVIDIDKRAILPPSHNNYEVQIIRTYYYRTPGTKGYSEFSNSKKTPRIANVKTTLIHPSGKPLRNKTFNSPDEWMMMNLGEMALDYIKDWWEGKVEKLQANNKIP